MRCPSCTTQNLASNRFCLNCGVPLVVACPQCSAESPMSAVFCGACGTRLARDQAPGGGVAGLASSSEEFKQATVLFADIVSSTRLLADLDPEQAMGRLRPAIRSMCEAVTRFDGTVVQTMGDGVLALFGAPRAQEGHAFLACEAALTLQASFAGAGGGPRIRVGLHTGEVVAGAPGSNAQATRDVHGVALHLASRLQELAGPGEIYMSEQCHHLIRSGFETAPLGARRLDGIPEPVAIFRLLGMNHNIAGREFRGASLTPFCGREHETGILRRTFRAIQRGETKVTGIVGAPGTGKSRLCFEFAEWCRQRGVAVYETRAQLYGHSTPLQLALDFLRLTLGIQSTDNPARARRTIADRLREIGSTFEADHSVLCEFLGLADHKPLWPNPRARHARLLDLLRHLVRQIGVKPSLIMVEDLHWADAASEEFLATLVEAAASTQTMLVFNYRPSYSAPFMQTDGFQTILLGELNPSDTEVMLDRLIGRRPELRELRRRVAERSGGNPFFVEELVRSLTENSMLLGPAGAYTLGSAANDNALPTTVQDVIGARIDHLGTGERAILQIGAIIGKQFALDVIETVANADRGEIEAALERLCEADMIESRQGTLGRYYIFRHPLIQEVAYRMQLKARRATLHASVAQAMRRFHENESDGSAALIAYHYEAAGDAIAAAAYWARAARWVGSTSSGEALKHWRKVRMLLDGQVRSPETDRLRIMANGQIAWLGWREGVTVDEARPDLEEALKLAHETDDTVVPLLHFVEARLAGASGGPADTYVARIEQALALLKADENIGRAATLYASLCQAYGWAGLCNEALAANDAALARTSSIDAHDHEFLGYNVEHWVISLRGRILLHLGRLPEARLCFDEMLNLEQVLIDPTVKFISHLGYVEVAWFEGDAALAAKHTASVTELAERHGSPYLKVFQHFCSGLAESIAGNWTSALRDLNAGLAFMHEMKAALDHEAETLACIAECHHEAGNHAQAVVTAKEAIAVARRLTARIPELRASIVGGAALLAEEPEGALAQAENFFDRAGELIAETGAIIFEPLLLRERMRLDQLSRPPLSSHK